MEHGHDALGSRPLGRIDELREDAVGAYYRVPLVPGVPQQIVEGLRAGLYGAGLKAAA
jgi:hypothetical protein